MSKLNRLWVRQSMVRSLAGKTVGADWPIRSILLERQISLISGHDYSQIIPALQSAKASGDSDQPTMIMAHTVKGKGVRFTEGKHEWHSKVATKEELKIIAEELGIEEALV